MKIDDIKISEAIIENYFKKLKESLELDVALVGAGPTNLVCGTILGENGIKAAIFEAKLSPGGGMWGGGMMFNEIVVQKTALALLQKMGVDYREYSEGYFTADSVETTSTFISKCVKSGTKIFNFVKAEDVMFREDKKGKRISGLVLNWSPVVNMGLHVDPLTVRSKYVVDGTGHDAFLAKTAKLEKTLQVKDQQLAKARHELVELRKSNKAFEAQVSERDAAVISLTREKHKLVGQIKKMKKSLAMATKAVKETKAVKQGIHTSVEQAAQVTEELQAKLEHKQPIYIVHAKRFYLIHLFYYIAH